MNLFDPERPKTASGQAQILNEPFIVPHVVVSPQQQGIFLLAVMLRNYAVENGYSYRFYRCPAGELETFFIQYVSDPEAALLKFFDWQPKISKQKQKTNLRISEIPDFL